MLVMVFLLVATPEAKASRVDLHLDSAVYHQSLDNFGYSLDTVMCISSASCVVAADEIPAFDTFRPAFGDPSAYLLKEKACKWYHFSMVNASKESLRPVLYVSADQLVVYLRSRRSGTTDTVYSGEKAYLFQVKQSKASGQSSHLARESMLISLSARDTLDVFIRCGPALQQPDIGGFYLSNESFYHAQFAEKRNRQLMLFWGLQGMFGFMVAFSLLMYFINRDRAYLYYSLYALALAAYLILTVPTDSFFCFGNFPRLQGILFNISAYAIPAMYGLFTLAYVHGNGYEPQLRRVILWVVYGTALGCVGSSVYLLFAPRDAAWYSFIFWVYTPVSSSFGVMAIYALFVYLRSPVRLVRYFGFATLFVVVSGLLILGGNYVLGALGNISNFPDMRLLLTFQLGGALQLLTFALSLSYRGRLIEQEKNQLKSLDQAKSHFFANVSHEFRTPLTLILGPVNDLLQHPRPEAEIQQLQLVKRNGQRLLRFVSQILDLAKLEEGQMLLEPIPGDLAIFARRITAAFESIAATKGISLHFQASPEAIMCMFDPDKLEKALNNLLSNACKFTPESGHIAVQVSVAPGNLIHIEVADDGPGIDPLHQTHLFDRFYQAHTADFTNHQPSTGIGLSLCKELVELHGGHIHLSSHPGSGSAFLISIPHIPATVIPPEDLLPLSGYSLEPLRPLPLPTIESKSNPRLPLLLLVEDNEDIALYLQHCLQDQFQLILATDGEMGLSQAIEKIPDLIITDVMMPRKDGYQLTRELKANEKTSHIPVLILTGKYSPESRIRGLKTDADAYLTKPFDAHELRATIGNLLNNRKRLQEKYGRYIRIMQHGGESEPIHSPEEMFLQRCLAIIRAHMSEEAFSVEDFAREVNMDRSQLFRKLKALTDQSPSRFMRAVRLLHAREQIASGTQTIAEIAYAVGFGSPTYFNRVFKEEFGIAPGELRKP